MISWLNFEEVLIHNPIELINFSQSEIQVALTQKQYIDFFSNKATYNLLYYDENMDFCVLAYADPLQSKKNGNMYAQGFIDVSMKIYRLKVLTDVTIRQGKEKPQSWAVTKTGMRVSPHVKNISLVLNGALMKIETTNNITGWTDNTRALNFSGQDFIIDGYGMRGLHNG